MTETTSRLKPDPTGRPRWPWAAILLGLVVLRLGVFPPPVWWRDWVLIVLVYWGFSMVASTRRLWPLVTLATMGYLLGIYLIGNLGFVLARLGIGP